jgi:hypothetical protein
VSAVVLKHCGKYPMHIYEVRPSKDHRGVDLISDVLPFGRHALIRVFDAAGNVIETHEHKGDFREF